ncbi:hypothetical protein VTN96DRAFT_4655 [Rasamsonia emersonii]
MGIFVLAEVVFDTLRLYPLGKYTRSWNKAFTGSETKTQQKTWIQQYRTEESSCEHLLQRETYLKEEIDALQKLPEKDLTTDEVAQKLRAREDELARIKQVYWLHRQKLGNLQSGKPQGGAWIREFDLQQKQRKTRHWKKDREACELRGGCCDRDCGCCERARKILRPEGKTMEKKKMHCSVACGCCVRSRGFEDVDPELRKSVQ